MPKREDRKVSFLELFFDLVFVYAITQIVGFIRDRHSVGSYASAALIFLVIGSSGRIATRGIGDRMAETASNPRVPVPET